MTATTYNGQTEYVGGNSVPQPGMLDLMGLGGITAMRRRRRSTKA